MSQIASIFIAILMILSGGYGVDAGLPSARTLVLSCPEIAYEDHTATLTEELAMRIGVQTESDRAFLDFSLVNDGETLYPLQFGAEAGKGFMMIFPKSGRSYLFDDLHFLMEMAGIEEEPDLSMLEDEARFSEFIDFCRALGTVNVREVFSEFIIADRDALAECVVKGPPVRQEITRDGVTYPVKTYRYSVGVPTQAAVDNSVWEKLSANPVFRLIGEETFNPGTYYTVNSIEEHIGIDCDFYEQNGSYDGVIEESTRLVDGVITTSCEVTTYEEDYSYTSVIDLRLSEYESRGMITQTCYPESYGRMDVEFDLKHDSASGGTTGFVQIKEVIPEVPEGVEIRIDFFGGSAKVALGYAGITASFRAEVLDTPIEDHGASAKEVVFDNAADMIGLSLTMAALESDLAVLENDEDLLAFVEDTNLIIEAIMQDEYAPAGDEPESNDVFCLRLAADNTIHIALPPADSSESLHYLAPGMVPDGYELETRAAILDYRIVNATLTCPGGTLTIAYTDNPCVPEMREYIPELNRSTIIELGDSRTFITRLQNGVLLNIMADFPMTMADANRLLDLLS